METLFQDFRFAVRTLRKQPVVTLVAVVSLALGIGANTTIFTIINAVFLSPVPVQDPSRLVMVHTVEWEFPDALTGVSFANYEDVRDGTSSFAALSAFTTTSINYVPANGEAVQITAQLVTGNFFDMLGVPAYRGRTFLPEEDAIPTPVIILSHGIWQRVFGGDPDIVGREINLSGRTFDIIGVTPPNFRGLRTVGNPDLVWMPMEMSSLVLTGILGQYFHLRRARFAQIIGRLDEGVNLTQADAEVHAIGLRLEQEFPSDNRGRELVARPFSTVSPNQREQYTRAGTLMMSVVAVVLLIACANVANILLARAADREKEIAIRVAVGAERSRIIRQLLTESVLLATAAGVLGVVIAFVARDLLWNYRPPNLGAHAIDLSLNMPVLFFTLSISLLTGITFGLVPAIHASAPDLRGPLQEGGRRSETGSNKTLLRKGLVVTEIALALVALVGAGLFIRSLQNAREIDPGFESQRLALMQINIGNSGYDKPQGKQFYTEMLARLETVPGVEAASVSSGRILGGGLPHTTYPEGVDIAEGRGLHVQDIVVSPSYFETVGIGLRSGRLLSEFDREGGQRVAVINEATKRLFWPDTDPVGRRFTRSAEEFTIEVVGVVADVLIDLGEPAQPIIYTPLDQFYQSAVQLQVQTAADPNQSLEPIRTAIREIDPAVPLLGVTTIVDDMQEALWAPRMGATLLGVFGLLALALAVVGIYGVMSYSVRQRHHEIGLRLALGAQTTQVVGLVIRQGMTLVVVGIIVGVGLALISGRLLQNMLWNVSTADPITFISVAVVLGGVAFLATFIPGLRVTRVDPLIAMRDEY